MNFPVTVGYTVFNKERLVADLVKGVVDCFNEDDEIIFLFDNCSDNSEEIAKREFDRYKRDFKIIKPEIEQFEVKANNIILKEASNEVIVLFQDDMICEDVDIKMKIGRVLDLYKDRLGLLGGRDGFEIRETSFPEKTADKVSSWQHIPGSSRLLDTWECEERTVLNRGPLVFRKSLIDKVGYLDEWFYPLWGDDMDYCFRCKYEHGLTNVVFQCGIKSLLGWGSTRKGSSIKKHLPSIMRNNWSLLVERWGKYMI